MIGGLLVGCGLVIAGVGGWRGYAAARLALAPLVHDGDPTGTALEASRPLVARPRVRLFARRVVAAMGWTALAMYGLLMIVEGGGLPS